MLLVRASVRSRCARAGAAPAATRSAVGDGDHHAPVGVLGLGLLLFGALALVCQRLALALAGDLEGHPGCLVLEMVRSEEHTSELQSRGHLVCRLLLEKKKRENKI